VLVVVIHEVLQVAAAPVPLPQLEVPLPQANLVEAASLD
tara:strand:+ start:119 stop:235 length:117 start_codon:yes stop_codon:yes gene_type:complete